MPNQALPKQVDYHRNMRDAPKYRNLHVAMINNAQSNVNPATSTSTMLQWKFPSGVTFNLSRSSLSYNVSGAAQGAGVFLWIANDCFQIAKSLQIITAKSGIVLVDIQDLNRYSKIVDKYYTGRGDYLSRAVIDLQAPCSKLKASNPINTISANIVPADNVYGLDRAAAKNDGFVDYAEPQYYAISPAPGNTAFGIAKTVKFSDFGHSTLLELDKDLCFNEDVYLNLWTSPVDQFCFTSTSATQIAGVAAATAGSIAINNITFNLAVEDNQILSDSVQNKYRTSGITLPTDFLLMSKNTLNGPQSNLQLNIPQVPNAFLKSNINFVYNGVEDKEKMYDCHNLNGEKILSYQTLMDQKQLQNLPVTCLMNTYTAQANADYRENEKFIKDSVIQGVPMYQYNWVHIDEFSGEDALEKHKELNDENVVTGLDLNISRTYQLNLQTPLASAVNPMTEYTYSVISKTLRLGPHDISFV